MNNSSSLWVAKSPHHRSVSVREARVCCSFLSRLTKSLTVATGRVYHKLCNWICVKLPTKLTLAYSYSSYIEWVFWATFRKSIWTTCTTDNNLWELEFKRLRIAMWPVEYHMALSWAPYSFLFISTIFLISFPPVLLFCICLLMTAICLHLIATWLNVCRFWKNWATNKRMIFYPRKGKIFIVHGNLPSYSFCNEAL